VYLIAESALLGLNHAFLLKFTYQWYCLLVAKLQLHLQNSIQINLNQEILKWIVPAITFLMSVLSSLPRLKVNIPFCPLLHHHRPLRRIFSIRRSKMRAIDIRIKLSIFIRDLSAIRTTRIEFGACFKLFFSSQHLLCIVGSCSVALLAEMGLSHLLGDSAEFHVVVG